MTPISLINPFQLVSPCQINLPLNRLPETFPYILCITFKHIHLNFRALHKLTPPNSCNLMFTIVIPNEHFVIPVLFLNVSVPCCLFLELLTFSSLSPWSRELCSTAEKAKTGGRGEEEGEDSCPSPLPPHLYSRVGHGEEKQKWGEVAISRSPEPSSPHGPYRCHSSTSPGPTNRAPLFNSLKLPLPRLALSECILQVTGNTFNVAEGLALTPWNVRDSHQTRGQ